MARDTVDHEGMASEWATAARETPPPPGMPFNITRLGHTVVRVADLERSLVFYRDVLGFKVSDVYPDTMMPGGMVFLRFAADHHSVALVGGASGAATGAEMHHMAFEVATLDEVIRARDHLREHNVEITYEGRRRAGCQIAVEFTDPDGHSLEIYWGLDQVGSDDRSRPADEWRAETTLAGAIANAPPGQDTALHDASLKP